MKLLLDENLPKRLKADFLNHEVFTVRDCGWNGTTNGALLALMLADGFDVLITFDKNIQHQQNFTKYPIPVIVLDAPDNTYQTLSNLIASINELLEATLTAGPIVISLK
jgi:predicted nuclease of predicted toxin-antitoxin system